MDTYTHSQSLARQLGLYTLTLLLEVPVMLLRVFVVWVVAAFLLFVTGHSTAAAGDWALIGLWPTVWSISALIPSWGSGRNSQIALGCVLGVIVLGLVTGVLLLALLPVVIAMCVLVSPWATGWWWRTRVGGREPSTRELKLYKDAVHILQQQAADELALPANWFVLDLPEPEAAVSGQTLMFTHAMLRGRELPGVLAHELGHLNSLDARINAAINRLIIHPLREPHPDQDRCRRQRQIPLSDDPITNTIIAVGVFAMCVRTVLRCCRGGLGLWLLRALWGVQRREGEYQADAYAAGLGYADDLARFLEINSLIYDQPTPFTWFSAPDHPPTELRIDRLERWEQASNSEHQPAATGVEEPELAGTRW